MLGLGAGEIFLILVFALIFIGPKKLPELARSLGKGVREFQNAKDELLTQMNNPDNDDNLGHSGNSGNPNNIDDHIDHDVAKLTEHTDQVNESDDGEKKEDNTPV